jgi:hypothetical protein
LEELGGADLGELFSAPELAEKVYMAMRDAEEQPESSFIDKEIAALRAAADEKIREAYVRAHRQPIRLQPDPAALDGLKRLELVSSVSAVSPGSVRWCVY